MTHVSIHIHSMALQADGGATIGGFSTEFQIGQSFQNKDEAVLSVKDYSIRRGVEYRMLESDHLKYHGKCKKFGKGCSWLIRVSLRARKGTWEVRRADAAVTVKVLQQATEADYGFRPSYRKTFPPCIEAFQHCKPLVSIDGTHLYGKYGDTLLLAIAQDGNSNILPIAFALVEGENAESCLSFKGKDARRMLVNAAYAKTEAEFYYWFDIMRTENPAMCDWANRMEYDKWTQHQDSGRQFGHMTTNISECVNSVLKGTRNLPVTSLVKSTYGRLAELFVVRGHGGGTAGNWA
ncbi:uncharacterized protein [Arachis hypogaea]|uniref:uncharacterized protein n=1 Tax=Arachis hypogaea TaxID=3818 RepID=UPI003B222B3A